MRTGDLIGKQPLAKLERAIVLVVNLDSHHSAISIGYDQFEGWPRFGEQLQNDASRSSLRGMIGLSSLVTLGHHLVKQRRIVWRRRSNSSFPARLRVAGGSRRMDRRMPNANVSADDWLFGLGVANLHIDR